MRINLHFLEECLSDLGFQGHIKESYYDRRLGWPELCDEWPKELSREVLYVVGAGALPADPTLCGKAAFLCIGQPPSEYLEKECNFLFTTKDDVTPSQVMNRVAAEFARYSQWESAMKSALAKQSIQKMAKLTAQLLQNPVEIWETGYYLLCSCAPDLDYDCPALEEFKKNYVRPADSVMSEEEFEMLMTDEEYLASSSIREPTIYSGKPHGFRTLFYIITVSDTPVARICVSEIVHGFAGRDFAVLRLLGDYAARILFQASPHSFLKENRYLEVVTGLLDHRLQSESNIERFLSERRWGLDDRYVCFVVKTRIHSQSAESDLAAFAFRFAEFFDETCYVLHGSNLMFLFNLTRANRKRESVYRQAVPLLRDSLLVAGVSTVFCDFRELYYFYQQAMRALELGDQLDPQRWYYKFDDFQFDFLLSQYSKGAYWKTLIPTGLFILDEYDEQKGTELVRTLRTYLEEGCDTAATVETLFIHRNTLAYRLERIEKIAGVNFGDTRQRLIMQLALLILDEHSD